MHFQAAPSLHCRRKWATITFHLLSVIAFETNHLSFLSKGVLVREVNSQSRISPVIYYISQVQPDSIQCPRRSPFAVLVQCRAEEPSLT